MSEEIMKSRILGLRVAGTIFALVCVGHILRLLMRIDVVFASWHLPLWMNVIGAMVTGALSVRMWKLSGSDPADEKKHDN